MIAISVARSDVSDPVGRVVFGAETGCHDEP